MHSRRLAGKLAKVSGANFEITFQKMCEFSQVPCVRIPDGCRTVGKGKLIRVKTPFDFVIGYEGQSAFIDTKTVSSSTFTSSMIVEHQLKALISLASFGRAGYVIGFPEKVYFVPVIELVRTTKGNSIDLSRCLALGNRNLFDPRMIFKSSKTQFEL